jgi:hypothetical protein
MQRTTVMKSPPFTAVLTVLPLGPDTVRNVAPGTGERLTAYEAAVKTIFVAANGLDVYDRTYSKPTPRTGWVAGSRREDRGKVVWRDG